MLAKAIQLCGGNFGVLYTFDGTVFTAAATLGLPPAYDEYAAASPRNWDRRRRRARC